MARTVYFVKVDGELYDGVLTYKPNHDDLIGICMDMGFDRSYAFDSLDVEVERVDIGSGESGVCKRKVKTSKVNKKMKG